MAFTQTEEKNITRGFYASIFLKGIISFGEILIGTLALFIPLSYATDFALKMLQIFPHNSLEMHLESTISQFATVSGIFIATYLISRGLVKILLIIGMLKRQLWAYPTSLIVLACLVMYQIFQIITTGSIAIIALTLFDLVVMWFIYEEYQVLKNHTQS